MTETNNLNVTKKLSDLIEIIGNSFVDLATNIELAFKIGREEGLTDIQVGDLIRHKTRGLKSPRTIQRMLPDTAKHKEFSNKPEAVKMSASKQPPKFSGSNPNRRLVVPEEPKIPPPPEVHREAEIIREPPKAIVEPLAIPKSETIEVVFDPAPIDRDRTQVFIMQIDIVTKKVTKYKTVGRRSVR